MNSISCALVVALFVSLAIAAPTTTIASATNKTLESFGVGQSITLGDFGPIVIVFGVTPCMSSCVGNMTHAFNDTDADTDIDEGRHVTILMDDICDNYFAAASCLRKCPEGDEHLFDVISAGAQYMCVEERTAFERAMPCIRKEKKALKQECDQKCAAPQPQDQEANSEDDDSADTTTAIPSQSSNSSDPMVAIGNLCTSLHCSIECGRDFLNEQCDKDLHAGSLVTEVIVRSLEKNAEFLKEQLSPEQEMSIAQVLPKSCFFLGDEEQLNELRDGWTAWDGKELEKQQSKKEPTTPLPVVTIEHRQPSSL